MSTKHTPGPWDAHGTTLLGAPAISLTTCKLFPRFICHVEGENREADAKLIAAAPEMLARLEQALAYLEHPDVLAIPFAKNTSVMANQVRAAIKNASL
jgi:hypothetical protein